jgi:hypothetical protein
VTHYDARYLEAGAGSVPLSPETDTADVPDVPDRPQTLNGRDNTPQFMIGACRVDEERASCDAAAE